MGPTRRTVTRTFVAVSSMVGCSTPNPRQPHQASTSITGQVAGKDGPEAGVWVIAETDDLHTGYAKIVVTDDHICFEFVDME